MRKFFFISLLIWSTYAFTQPIGKIVEVDNKVIARKESKERVLTVGSLIYERETIITPANTKAKLQYLNGTLVTIQQNSNYETAAYVPQNMQANLSNGAIEYSSKSKKKALIQTPVVALAIQGTRFKLIATPDNTYIEVSEGLVKGGDVLLGPSQPYNSGSFNRSQTFTPGSIPWDSYTSATIDAGDIGNSFSFDNELNTSTIDNLAISTAINTLVTQSAEIAVAGCH